MNVCCFLFTFKKNMSCFKTICTNTQAKDTWMSSNEKAAITIKTEHMSHSICLSAFCWNISENRFWLCEWVFFVGFIRLQSFFKSRATTFRYYSNRLIRLRTATMNQYVWFQAASDKQPLYCVFIIQWNVQFIQVISCVYNRYTVYGWYDACVCVSVLCVFVWNMHVRFMRMY